MTGQYITQKTGRHVNSKMREAFKTNSNYVVYSDTDSIFFWLEDVVNKANSIAGKTMNTQETTDFVVKYFNTKLTTWMNEATESIATELNSRENRIQFKQEAISESGFWLAKKRYALRVIDNEGVRYNEPDTKITGIEVVRSSTPAIARKWLKDAVELVLDYDKDGLVEYVEKHREMFMKLGPSEAAFPRSANNLAKYGDAKTIYSHSLSVPIAVRASLLYNSLISKYNLDKKYEKIREGDKIKFIYLREPNTLRENVIAFNTVLPEEFDLHKYVDYETQFQKVFLDPLNKICTAIGWQLVEEASLDDFFS